MGPCGWVLESAYRQLVDDIHRPGTSAATALGLYRDPGKGAGCHVPALC
jgi:hypothetical protein